MRSSSGLSGRSALLAAPIVLAALSAPVLGGVLKGPYLIGMMPGSVRVRVETDTRLETRVVCWFEDDPERPGTFPAGLIDTYRGKVEALSAQNARKTVEHEEDRFLYEARLDGLRPGLRHRYRVFHGGEPVAEGSFRAFGEHAPRTVFVAFGDVRTGHEFHRAIAQRIREVDPDFITIAGDLVVNGKSYPPWSEFFRAEADLLREVPIFPAWGNHEDRGGYFERFFSFPDFARDRSPFFYRRLYMDSFDCGPVHVLLLDSGVDPDRFELDWIERDLERAKEQPWKIAVYHHPSFNEGGHASSYGLGKLLPVLKKHRLDLTITGHSHLYERTFPLKSFRKEEKPIVHVVAGGGGAPLVDDLDLFYLARHRKAYHFLRLEADRESLSGTAIDIDGKVFDRFVLQKPPRPESAERGGGPAAREVFLGGAGYSPVREETVVAEENVALWRALRERFDSGIRLRVPEAKKGESPGLDRPPLDPGLRAGIPWAFRFPACPIPGEMRVSLRLLDEDAARWKLWPDSDSFAWGASAGSRSFRIGPRTAAVLAARASPRLRLEVRGPQGDFAATVPLKISFPGDGPATRRGEF